MDVFTRIQKTEKVSQVVQAFGVSGYSPLQMSRGLASWGFQHVICSYVPTDFRYRTRIIKGKYKNLPAVPVVCVGLDSISKFKKSNDTNYVLFVCDAPPKLTHTNLEGMPEPNQPLNLRLKAALLYPWKTDLVIALDEPSLSEYIEQASKPSVLRTLQTLLYKIHPYSLRKDMQAGIFAYLAGGSKASLYKVLGKHIRGDQLKDVLLSSESQILVQAVKEVQAGSHSQEVADRCGLDVFDINYVLASTKNAEKTNGGNSKRRTDR